MNGTLNNLAVIKIEQDQIAVAKSYYLKAIELFESLYKKQHFEIIKYYHSTKTNLSRLYQEKLKNKTASIKHAKDIIQLADDFPKPHPSGRFILPALMKFISTETINVFYFS